MLSVPLVAALAIMGGSGCSSKSAAPVSCPSPVSTTSIVIADFSFTPSCTAAAPGASLSIKNSGVIPHTYTVRGTSIDVMLAAGQSTQVTLSGVAPGTYSVVCTIHPNMMGSLKVG